MDSKNDFRLQTSFSEKYESDIIEFLDESRKSDRHGVIVLALRLFMKTTGYYNRKIWELSNFHHTVPNFSSANTQSEKRSTGNEEYLPDDITEEELMEMEALAHSCDSFSKNNNVVSD